MTRQTPTTERTTPVVTRTGRGEITRSRPRWARFIRHLGEDLSWAINGWTDFPRSVRRTATGVAGATAGWLMGFHDIGIRFVESVGG